jgi:isoleucyl-tRNA synthetase
MVISPAEDSEWDAVKRYHQLIEEELNIKAVRCVDWGEIPGGTSFRMNPKTTGSKFGKEKESVWTDVNKVLDDLGSSGQIDLLHRSKLVSATEYPLVSEGLEELKRRARSFNLQRLDLFERLSPEDILVRFNARDGWTAVEDRDRLVLIDHRITEDLKLEGLAREIVRHVQELRKTAGLEMEYRIVLSLQTYAPGLKKAIETHKDYICRETLAVKFTMELLREGVHRAEVKVDRETLVIELRKA